MPFAYRLACGLLGLAVLSGCETPRRYGLWGCWADYNSLQAPAISVHKFDRRPYKARRVKHLRWMYNTGGDALVERPLVLPPSFPVPPEPPVPPPPGPHSIPEAPYPTPLPPAPGVADGPIVPRSWETDGFLHEELQPPEMEGQSVGFPVWYRELDGGFAQPTWSREL
jgi:hypothetical protein